jgi:hypothetical protein
MSAPEKDFPEDTKSISTDADDLVDKEPPPFRLSSWLFNRQELQQDLDAVSTRRSVFDDPDLAAHYWPKKEYENLHRFDPKARWTYREEQALVCHISSGKYSS